VSAAATSTISSRVVEILADLDEQIRIAGALHMTILGEVFMLGYRKTPLTDGALAHSERLRAIRNKLSGLDE
jgi:hypothetical protein